MIQKIIKNGINCGVRSVISDSNANPLMKKMKKKKEVISDKVKDPEN